MWQGRGAAHHPLFSRLCKIELSRAERKFGGRSTHREVVLASQADLLHLLRVAELSGSPRDSLGGDPSAGSPTDTLFTVSPCRHGAWTVSSSGASRSPACSL